MLHPITRYCVIVLALLTIGFSSAVEPVHAAQKIKIGYVDWSSSIASAHMVQAVLQEKLGQAVELQRMEADEMWAAVADGRVDAILSAWLPITHQDYMAQYKDQVDDLGPTWREHVSAWSCQMSGWGARLGDAGSVRVRTSLRSLLQICSSTRITFGAPLSALILKRGLCSARMKL